MPISSTPPRRGLHPDFSEGDEVIVKELRTKIDLPGSTGAWVTIPGPVGSHNTGTQAFIPYSLLEKVQPEVKVGDVWKGDDGTEWYVRRAWTATTNDVVIESFISPAITYGTLPSPGRPPISQFFTDHKPVLVHRSTSSY